MEPQLINHAKERDVNAFWMTCACILEEGIIEASGIEKEGNKAARGRGRPFLLWTLQRPKLPSTHSIRSTTDEKKPKEKMK